MTGTEYLDVETPFGSVRGARSNGVAAFHRVPYAEAPVGSKRFEMPGAPPRWRDIRDGTIRGPIPPQLPSRLDAVNGVYEAEQSEDCLHLDIWTIHATGAKAPVLVFIHGGAFMTGGGSLACYDGGVLAKEHGLVVVNITYRLGLLGFLPQPGLGSLNVGLHDQLAALRWMREAIDCFGGDPERITVIGQSAGAFSIAAFLGHDLGRGLFDQAIMMSAPVGIALRTVEQARPLAAALLDVLGVGSHDLDKLRTMPVARILERLRVLQRQPPVVPGDITPPFMPILDGTLLPRDPLASLKNGGAAWCDIVIGVTREEYAAFSISNPSLDDLTEEELRSRFERELGRGAEEALAKIRSSRVPATPRAVLCDLHSAQTFINDSLAIAATQSGLGRNAFAYMFDWQSPTAGLGACHCIDLPFLFGNLDVWKAAPMLKGANWQEVEELSRIFRGAVAAFAENGNPNKAGLPGWPAFKSDRAVLHFDRQIRAFGWIA